MEEQDKTREGVTEGEPFEIDELDDRGLESASGGVSNGAFISPVESENASGCNASGCNTGC